LSRQWLAPLPFRSGKDHARLDRTGLRSRLFSHAGIPVFG
jgi:hypothetical protein